MSLMNDGAALLNKPLEQQARIILAFAKVLFVNGQTTTQVIREAKKIGKVLGLNCLLMIRWGELWLQVSDKDGLQVECLTDVDPVGMHMGRVIATMRLLQDFYQGERSLAQVYEQLATVSNQPPFPTWLFTFAAACGAVALGVIFGMSEWSTAGLIFLSAGLGALFRRQLARLTVNIIVQPLVAALIAGLIGAIAVYFNLSTSLRLIALCPCMVLVPGPHFLNSALDFIHGRMHLGSTRLALAGLICASISMGVLVGMKLLGGSLPVDPSSYKVVPLWHDMLAAGVAIFAYSIFFSTPMHLIAWPLVIGVLAHMLRWICLIVWGTNLAFASFVACLLAGSVLTLIAYRQQMPFAALAFAAVVSMIPGVFLFRMASGIVGLTTEPQISFNLLSQTIYDGLNALTITIAISAGLLGPKVVIDKIKSRMG